MHEIFGERFAGRDKPAWHGLGTVFTDAVTAVEALELAGLDYEVRKLPVVAAWTYEGGGYDTIEGERTFMLTRAPTQDDPQPRELGMAGKDYEVLQNREMAEILDPFTDEWPVETAYALRNGAIVGITLNLGQFAVLGDRCTKYLSLTSGHDGTRAVRVKRTAVREVCMNTLVWSDATAEETFVVPHRAGVKREASWYVETITATRHLWKQVEDSFTAMGETKITPGQAVQIHAKAFPVPEEPRKLAVARLAGDSEAAARLERELETRRDFAKKAQDQSWLQYEAFNDAMPTLASTAWAGWQSANEVSNWREGPRANESVLFGVRADEIKRAYAQAMEYVPVR